MRKVKVNVVGERCLVLGWLIASIVWHMLFKPTLGGPDILYILGGVYQILECLAYL